VKQFSKWQKKNLDQILLFGVAINCLWNLTDPITDSLSFENKWPIDIERVEMLINFSTSSINQILS
jgi:hypothetical protein